MSDEGEGTSHKVLDTEKIILEVEKRPALYNKELKEYSDRNAKEQLWTEVCTNVISKWHELCRKKRQWKRSSKKVEESERLFCARARGSEKKNKSGEPAKKQRKYIYFDSLLFLLPHQQPRATSSKVEPPGDNIQCPNDNNVPAENDRKLPDDNGGSTNDNVDLPGDNGGPRNDNGDPPLSVPSAAPPQRTARSRPSKSSHQASTYEASLFEILKKKSGEEASEDKHFALMLVPMLAKLNDEQKHFAKIEILNVMKNAKLYTTPFPQQQVYFTQPGPSTQTNFHNTLHPGPSHMQYQTFVQLSAASPQFSSHRTSVGLSAELPQCSNHSENSTSIQTYYSQFSNDILSPTSTDSNEMFDL